ncbi:MAG: ABC transporter permease, partial [Gemmatimonadetes bacterium]|nr:ABC transporter permease [Gemmatimonadota bacterium]
EDVRKEIEAHLRAEEEELVRAGWDPEAARAEALRRFGEVGVVQEDCERITRQTRRATRRTRGWQSIRQDVGYAVRRLARSPGFTALAVGTLALGIGANTAIFSLIDGVLLAPLPYAEPDGLVTLAEEHEGGRPGPIPWPNYQDWRARSRSLQQVALYGGGTTTVLGGTEPVRAEVAPVSEDFFPAFRATAQRGRTTLPDDHRPGAAPVAVVAHSFWRDQLAQDPDVLERSLQIYGRSLQIVGVLPEGFDFPRQAEIWVPMELLPQSDSRTAHNWSGVGRLAPGQTAADADREADALAAALAAELPADDYDAVGGVVTPLKETLTGATRTPLLVLLGASALILLIACVNLASTVLARGAARATELAVRSSLGASRARLVQQLATESMVLAAVGGGVGIGVAWVVLAAVLRYGTAFVPGLADVSLDGSVLGFTLLATVATGLLFGLFPALRLASDDLAAETRSGTRAGESPQRARTWRLLVGAEVALALLLLVGSGLLIRSFGALVSQETGISSEGVAMAQLALDPVRYSSMPEVVAWYERLARELDAHPAIEAVGVANAYPVSGGMGNGTIQLDGDMSREAYGWYVTATAGYFAALDIPLLEGRMFDGRDHANAPHVALVSRSFAEEAWPGENPIGRQITGGGMDDHWEQPSFATVVGVVGDVRYRGLAQPAEPTFYFHLPQRPYRARTYSTVVARGVGGDASAAGQVLGTTLRALDPDLPPRIESLDTRIGDSVGQRRFVVVLLGAFAATALLLALIGLYGVVSYRVARRTREVGVRIALGAGTAAVRRLVIRDALGMVAGGLVVGVLLALALGSTLRSMLYGVASTDPLTFLLAVPVLMAGAFLATWIPARRATRVDPTSAMRAE